MDTVVSFLSSTWNIILTIIAFSFIIFVHELGHYIMAVRAGVKVDKFYVGFDFGGLKIFSFNHKGTEYGIGVFPFGGYVKLYGMEELPGHEMEVSELPQEHFQSKTIGERFGIMIGGVAMNFISAVLLILIMYGIGKNFDAPVLGPVHGVPALKAGLKENDKILEIGGQKVRRFFDIHKAISLAEPNEPLEVKIERDGKKLTISTIPEMNYAMGMPSIGVIPQDSLKIAFIVKDSPLALAGALPGDVVLKVNGKKIEYSFDLQKVVDESIDKEVSLVVLREGKEVGLIFKPKQIKKYKTGLRNNSLLEVSYVHSGSAAEKAKMKDWDFIKSINGIEIRSIDEISQTLESANGQSVEMQVVREDKLVNLTVLSAYDKRRRQYLMGVSISFSGEIEPIKSIEINGPLYSAGLRVGDKIVSVNDRKVSTISQLYYCLDKHFNKSVSLSYVRKNAADEIIKTTVGLRSPTAPGIFTRMYHKVNVLVTGDEYIYDRLGLGVKFEREFVLAEPLPDSAASTLEFKAGDQLVEISYSYFDDKKKYTFSADEIYRGWKGIDDHYTKFSRLFAADPKYKDKTFMPMDYPIDVKLIRDGKELSTIIIAKEFDGKGFSGAYFDNQKVLLKYGSVQEAFTLCYDETLDILDMTATSLGKLVVGKISTDNMSGPIGIGSLMYQIAKKGFIDLIWIVAMLSINIGFLNFLPFPPLDGGALFFLLIEKIKGSPVSAQFQIVVANVGILLLLSLMFFVTVSDISKHFG